MEFTYQGLVRYGYGFFNPNHAAAAIVLLMPILWYVRRVITSKLITVTALTLEILLYFALVFTFSRSGALALLLTATVWWFFARDSEDKLRFVLRRYKRILFLLMFLGVAFYSGAANRFTASDKAAITSTTNRFTLWEKGLQLLSTNPDGVSAGNSGRLVTLFFIDNSHDVYRTMVNSFLTIMVEHGFIVGGIVLFMIFFASTGLLSINKDAKQRKNKPAQYLCAVLLSMLTAGIISGMTSTCYDLNMLLSPETIYNTTNDFLQAALLIAFYILLVLAFVYTIIKLRKRLLVFSTSLLLAIITCLVMNFYGALLSSMNQVKVYHGDNSYVEYKAENNSKSMLMITDDIADKKTLLQFIKKEFKHTSVVMPLEDNFLISEFLETYPDKQLLLCGDNASSLLKLPVENVILFKPTLITAKAALAKVRTIYLPRWDEKGDNQVWQSLQKSNNFQIKYVEF